MSGISNSSTDSHEFILLPEQPPASTVVTLAPTPPIHSTSPSSGAAPSSPPRQTRRLVKRSHAVDEPPVTVTPPASASPSPPHSPPVPPFSSGGHSRRGSSSPGRGSRAGSPPIIASTQSLVGDVQMSRTRVIISKTHTIYDPEGMPFRSALIGFRATFHSPPAASARVRDAEITLRFLSSQSGLPAPVIKAITPSGSMGVGPSTSVTDSYSTTAGLHLGYTSAGTLELSRTASTSYTHSTSAKVSSSGVETNELWLTLKEDPISRQGIPSNVDFAALIMLTSPPPFEAELSVGVTIGRGPSALLKMLSSPQEWIALYDGETTLNPLRLSTPASSRLLRPNGLVAASSPSITTEDGDEEMQADDDGDKREEIRKVKRKPSTLEC
ncbi:hypothetical protein JCM3765_007742 [Sporobolomyces pararoseus]